MKVWIVWEEGYWYGDPYQGVNRICDSYEKAVDHIKSIATGEVSEVINSEGNRYCYAPYEVNERFTQTLSLTVHEGNCFEVF